MIEETLLTCLGAVLLALTAMALRTPKLFVEHVVSKVQCAMAMVLIAAAAWSWGALTGAQRVTGFVAAGALDDARAAAELVTVAPGSLALVGGVVLCHLACLRWVATRLRREVHTQ